MRDALFCCTCRTFVNCRFNPSFLRSKVMVPEGRLFIHKLCPQAILASFQKANSFDAVCCAMATLSCLEDPFTATVLASCSQRWHQQQQQQQPQHPHKQPAEAHAVKRIDCPAHVCSSCHLDRGLPTLTRSTY